ncbi:hypothetical protein D3C80_1853810 [compost metagenome]
MIKLGLVAQLIDTLQIAQEKSLGRVWRNLKGIKINPLFADIGSDANQVPLIGKHIGQHVMFKKAAPGRISLVAATPRFYRDSQMATVFETEAQKQMRNSLARPIGGDHINRF